MFVSDRFASVQLAAVFFRAVSAGGPKVALRVERGGKWKEWTWAEYGAEAALSARALMALGVEQVRQGRRNQKSNEPVLTGLPEFVTARRSPT